MSALSARGDVRPDRLNCRADVALGLGRRRVHQLPYVFKAARVASAFVRALKAVGALALSSQIPMRPSLSRAAVLILLWV
jgi:hypothetical protein